MAFSQSTISEVLHARDGIELAVSWTSSAPAGTVFQIYLAGRLAWHGQGRSCHLPWPSDLGPNSAIDVGTVGTDEAATDFSGSLPAGIASRVRLDWEGGTYLKANLVGFRIYSSLAAGGAVSLARPIATVPAYPGGFITDGFGMGGFGHGGFGRSASSYFWTTPSLGPGVWTFAVDPYDSSGNTIASPGTVSVTIAAPPQPPAADGRGVRLKYAYDPVLHKATLTWLASPG